jgi:hypothetical protein
MSNGNQIVVCLQSTRTGRALGYSVRPGAFSAIGRVDGDSTDGNPDSPDSTVDWVLRKRRGVGAARRTSAAEAGSTPSLTSARSEALEYHTAPI